MGLIAMPILILQIAACIGLGAVTLRALGILDHWPWFHRLASSFAIGFGLLGWLLFFFGIAGLFAPAPVCGLLFVGAVGVAALWRLPYPEIAGDGPTNMKLFDWALIAILAAAFFLDAVESLAPPADADSGAYHFALPKQFIDAGGLFFIKRAIDGAAPLLVQMTYLPVLLLGGELALTMWSMVTGWGAGALMYVVGREFLSPRWALAAVVIFITAPAIVYGGGTGQVEVRNSIFVLLAAFGVAKAITTGQLRFTILAGLGVGFFMAAKYFGSFFALACGLSILNQRKWFRHGFWLTAVAVLVGSQWYVWNFMHTGDPVFPMLHGVLTGGTGPYWDAAHTESLQWMFSESEQGVPKNLLWLIGYPIISIIDPVAQFESRRTGLGPYLIFVLPFLFGGLWRYRRRIRRHPVVTMATIAGLFYVFWFFIGTSQRVRHLVPVLPLFILLVTYLAARWSKDIGHARIFAGAVLITLGIQIAGHALFSLNFLRHGFTSETRDLFLQRNLQRFHAVNWINANLKPGDRIYSTERQLNYYLERPFYYASQYAEALIDIRPNADNPRRFLRQLNTLGITHVLATSAPSDGWMTSGRDQWRALYKAGCLKIEAEIEAFEISSRALGILLPTKVFVLKRQGEDCRL